MECDKECMALCAANHITRILSDLLILPLVEMYLEAFLIYFTEYFFLFLFLFVFIARVCMVSYIFVNFMLEIFHFEKHNILIGARVHLEMM